MAAFAQRTVLTQAEVWELSTPAAYVEVDKVLSSISAFLRESGHRHKQFDDVCIVTVGDDKIIFTVVVVDE